MNFKNKTANRSYTRACARRRTWRLGAVLAGAFALGAVAARAQGAPDPSDFAGQYAAAVSSSARLDAVMGAIRSGQTSQAAWLAGDFSSESEPVIRAWMLRGAARLAPQSNAALFEQGLKDPSAWVRLAAVESLGQLGAPRAVSDLAGVLSVETNPGVRQSAAYWLGQIGSPAAAAALGRALASDPNPNVRVQSARSLAAAKNGAGARSAADER